MDDESFICDECEQGFVEQCDRCAVMTENEQDEEFQ